MMKKNIPKRECGLSYFFKFETYMYTNKNTKVNKRKILLQET